MKHLRVFWQLFRINLKKSMIYRINFAVTIWSMFLWIGLYVVFFEVIFLHVDEVAGWGKSEMLTLLAFYYFIVGIGNVLYRESFEQFSEKVRRGEIDASITKPTSFQLLNFFHSMRIDHLIDLAVAGLLFLYVILRTDFVYSWLHLGVGMVFTVFSNVIFYSCLLMIAGVIFLVDRMEGAGSFMWHVSQIARFPRQIYTGMAGKIFKFILPIALISSIPTEISLQQGSPKLIGYFVGISIVFWIVANFIFKFTFKHYSSAN